MTFEVSVLPSVFALSVLAIGVGWGAEPKAAPTEMAAQPSSQSMYIQYKGAIISDKEYPNSLAFEFRATSLAREMAFTFDGIAADNGWADLATVTPHAVNGYTMTLDAGGGGILDRGWNTSINPFTGGVVGGFSAGLMVSFKRNDGLPFAAASVAVGSLLASYPTANWTVTGHFASGGSEQTILQGSANAKTERTFPSYFRNLTNLVFVGIGGTAASGPPAERPAFDELVLVDAPEPSSLVVMDFNGTVGDPGATFATFAANATYRQYGYSMTNSGGATMWFFDNDQSPSLNAFEDDVVQFSGSQPSEVRIERDDGRPFNAISLVIGGLVNGSLILTGNRVLGGTVTLGLDTQAGASTTATLPDDFRNLQSLGIAASTASGAAIDDLTLELYVPSGTVLTIR
jgi:hypothetical protein